MKSGVRPFLEQFPAKKVKALYIFYIGSGLLIILLFASSFLESIGWSPLGESQFLYILYLGIIFSLASAFLYLLFLLPFLIAILLQYRPNWKLSLPLIFLILSLSSLFINTYWGSGEYNVETNSFEEDPIMKILDYATIILFLTYAVTATILGWRGLKDLKNGKFLQ
jgi:glucan phosphoethanolaminetransferase (alkaline phosphatase superfamily)